MKQQYDIFVAGCGLAGLTQSLLLAQEGFSVAINGMPPHKNDTRTTAISYGSHLILKKTGIWDDVVSNACPIKDIHILDGQSSLLLDFNSEKEHNAPAFGWIIENKILFGALLKAVKKNNNIDLQSNSKVIDLTYKADCVEIILENDQSTKAKLVIGADGRQSFICKKNNFRSKQWQYNQTAIVCFIEHKNPHKNIAVEHFFSSGPFAVLPMNDTQEAHHSSIVWTVDSKDASQFTDHPKLLKTALQERLPDFYGTIASLTSIQAYPLSFNHAYHYVAHRTALIADAAHGIHPIAGQGLNLGLQDITALTDHLKNIKDKDFGLLKNLKAYEKIRIPENIKMAAATDILNRLFSNNNLLVSAMRKKGLKIIQRINPVKKIFSKTAMGLSAAQR